LAGLGVLGGGERLFALGGQLSDLRALGDEQRTAAGVVRVECGERGSYRERAGYSDRCYHPPVLCHDRYATPGVSVTD
jgi:hypothetical protein